ncbi:MAG: GNAT family N-acetyltransferase [Rhodobacteraceae bacterium]|nr:GNAT family N-acetyltransferase [Paracoccaceae bacterium]
MNAIEVRAMQPGDMVAACAILNQIIRAGGTTALETELDETNFARYYAGTDLIANHVALDTQGQVAGFQWLGVNKNLDRSCADIATFTRRTNPLRGAGRALFATTTKFAKNAGFAQINATIRADNVSGLGYYTKIGFVDFSVARAVPLRDETPVDRISKRYTL